MEQKIDRLTDTVSHMAIQLDHLAIAMLGQQTNIEDMQQRLGRVEANQERTFNRMDEFLVVLNRHDVELVAGQGAQRRFDERLERLEQA